MSKLSIVLKKSAAFRGSFFECKPLPLTLWVFGDAAKFHCCVDIRFPAYHLVGFARAKFPRTWIMFYSLQLQKYRKCFYKTNILTEFFVK